MRVFLADRLVDFSRPDLTDTDLMNLAMTFGIAFLTILAPLLVAMPLIGIVSNVAQSGFMLSSKQLMPDLSRVNPMDGFKRMFSLRIVIELVKTTIKLGIVGWLLYGAYVESFPIFLSLSGADLGGALGLFVDTAFSTAFTVGGAFLVLAMADYGYQRWEFMRGAQMTKQEIKEE